LFIPYKLKEENQMRTEIQVFTSEKFGQLRTSEIDGVIWFCGIDVAKALGYTNPRDAYKRHCKSKGVVKRYTPTDGGRQEMVYLDEGNVYRLITHSKLPSAERFESWVFDEVLPSIRRTGSYIGKSENPNVALVTITPEMAEEMLKKNIGNRKINQANVNRIAADMATGNYKLNGETIKISPNGEILDGQHRLLAAVKSGMTFRTYIVYNVERESIGTIDMGKGRSVADSLNVMGCNIKQGIIPAMNFYFNRGQKLTTAQAGCLWNTYEDKLNMICGVLVGSHHDYLLSQRDLRGFVIHLAISEKWSEDDLRVFVNGLKNKPNRDTTYELSAYNFRNWYDRKVHGKLRNLKSLGEKNKANVTLDALCTLAEGYTNGKLVRSFAWKNRAKGVLDTGYNIAQQRFIALTVESQSRIGMEE
jgi:prophage antirepressor-like protein